MYGEVYTYPGEYPPYLPYPDTPEEDGGEDERLDDPNSDYWREVEESHVRQELEERYELGESEV